MVSVLKKKVILKRYFKKNYDIMISFHSVTKDTLPCDSNCIVDVVMRPKPWNSTISIREVII